MNTNEQSERPTIKPWEERVKPLYPNTDPSQWVPGTHLGGVESMMKAEIDELRAALASQQPAAGIDLVGVLVSTLSQEALREHVEAVIACLGDDAATLRAENDEDERAYNMDAAAELLERLLASSPVQPQPQQGEAALMEVLKERDDATDFIDALLDEVLGTDRAEWSNLYGRAEALNEVQERMAALHKPMVDRAWGRFEAEVAASTEQQTCRYPGCKCPTEHPCLQGLASSPAQPQPQQGLSVAEAEALCTSGVYGGPNSDRKPPLGGPRFNPFAQPPAPPAQRREQTPDRFGYSTPSPMEELTLRCGTSTKPEAVPQGGQWKLVPVEPTWEMKLAASTAYREPRDGHYTARMECAADAYRVMLAAAPPSPQPPAEQALVPRVTAHNVGQWCKSEDDCIAQGIDFPAYEQGVADAAEAMSRQPALPPKVAQWAKTPEAETSEWHKGYEAARSWVAMQLHGIGTAKPAQPEFAGMPVTVNPDLPPGDVVFKDAQGKAVGTITNLAQPVQGVGE